MYARENEVNFVFAALDALGSLPSLAGVGALQRFLNRWAEKADYSPIGVDNTYGGCTHELLKRFAKWYFGQAAALPPLVESGHRFINRDATVKVGTINRYPGDAAVDDGGPVMVAVLLTTPLPPYVAGMTSAQLAEAQTGWQAWVEAGRPGCGASVDTSDAVLLTDGSDVPVGPTTEEVLPVTVSKKLGTLAWVGIGLVVVLGTGVVYHYATKPKESPVRALPAAVRRRHTLY